MLSLVTAGAPEGGLSGGCQGVILSSRRLNVKKENPIIIISGPWSGVQPDIKNTMAVKPAVTISRG